MTTIQELFQQAQLAEAAYADFSDPNVSIIAALQNTNNGGSFSLAQATAFVEEWTVVDQLPDTESGFSGTLFKNKAGEYSFSLRGTTLGVTDLMEDVADVLMDGIAIEQIVDMYNFWQSLTHVGVYQAKQLTTLEGETAALNAAYLISEEAGLAYEDTLRAQGNIIIDDPLHVVRTIQTVDSTDLSDAGLQMGSGKMLLSGTTEVNVGGHSLGGHLAMAFSRLFPDATSSAVAVNGAGFRSSNTNVDTLFALLSGESQFDADKITNMVGSAAMDLVSQDWLILQQPAGKKEIYTESANLDTAFGHGKSQMTDSLAIYNLFATVDENVSVETITGILNASSNVAGSEIRRNTA